MRRTPGLVIAASAALASTSTLAPGATAAPAQVSGYVVVLEDGAGAPAAVAERLADRYGGEVGFVYSHALRGFSIRTTDRSAAALANNPNVDYVEADGVMSVAAQVVPTGVMRVNALTNAAIDGVDGIGERVDVDVAVIDTGIDLDHPDLNVRQDGVNCLSGSCVAGGDDDHYHGTHVAGTVGALDNTIGVVGVAPGARLWPVKVLNQRGSGSTSGVIAGIDWVAASRTTAGREAIEVANLSLGGSYSSAMNLAVEGAVADGVSVVVAAGNSAKNVKDYSPASALSAITVSALADYDGKSGGLWNGSKCLSDTDDTFAYFSNFGDNDDADGAASAVDIAAPGVCINSTSPGGGYRTISGTSMASPHVAGAVALLRSTPTTGESLAESRLLGAGSLDWNHGSDDPDGTKEPLLDVSSSVFAPVFTTGDGGGTTPPANVAPSASFTSSCSGLTCSFTDTSDDSDGSISLRSWNFGDNTDVSTAQNPTHTYAAGGTYSVMLTVTDDDGATHSTSQQVTVSASSTSGPAFSDSSTNQGSTWTAIVTVTNGGSGTLYTGTWSNNGGTGYCTTNASGTCTISLPGIAKKVGSVTWTHSGGVVTVRKP